MLDLLRQLSSIPVAFAIYLVQITIGIVLTLGGLIAGVLLLMGADLQAALSTSEEVMTPIAEEMWPMPIIKAVFSVGKWADYISIAVFDYWLVSVPVLALLGANFMYELSGLKTKDSRFSLIATGRVLMEMLRRQLTTLFQLILGGAAVIVILTVMVSVAIGIGGFVFELSRDTPWSEALVLGLQLALGLVRRVWLVVFELLSFLPGFFERHTEFCLAILFVMATPGWELTQGSRRAKLGNASRPSASENLVS